MATAPTYFDYAGHCGEHHSPPQGDERQLRGDLLFHLQRLFHDEEFPSYRELYELFQKDYTTSCLTAVNTGIPGLKQEYVDKYRYGFGYHPYHAFSMISCGHIAEKEAAAVYIVGAYEPGYARSMGMKTRATFEEALRDAEKYVGKTPRILALPKTFKLAGVHLMMEDDKI